ncbi:MAG TPA: type II toxin-antitoxin system HicB family antitoxin [Bryobacteraceae bacterium]
MQYNYTVIVEKSENNYGAWAPDLPGCVSTGATVEETLANMREAIELHLEGMRADGDPIPEPSATAAVVQVAA